MVDNVLIGVHSFLVNMLTPFSVISYIVINFSLYIVRLQSIIYFHSVLLTNKIETHSSTLIFHMDDIKMVHRCKDLLITAHPFKNSRTFLTNYIQEKSYLLVCPTFFVHPNIFSQIIYVYSLKILFVILSFPRHIHLKNPDL